MLSMSSIIRSTPSARTTVLTLVSTAEAVTMGRSPAWRVAPRCGNCSSQSASTSKACLRAKRGSRYDSLFSFELRLARSSTLELRAFQSIPAESSYLNSLVITALDPHLVDQLSTDSLVSMPSTAVIELMSRTPMFTDAEMPAHVARHFPAAGSTPL